MRKRKTSGEFNAKTLRRNRVFSSKLDFFSYLALSFYLSRLDWKPLLMLTCTVVALGLAIWILVFKPGDDTAERAAVARQEVVEEASKPDEALDAPASSTR